MAFLAKGDRTICRQSAIIPVFVLYANENNMHVCVCVLFTPSKRKPV